MAGQKFTLTFDANLNVSQMKGALNQIQNSLNGLHLPQNMAKGLQNTFANLEKEIQNFENLANKGITKASDMSALEKSSEKILNFYNLLQIKIKDLGNLAGKDLNKLFPQQVVDQINAGLNALKQYETEIKNIQDKVNKSKSNVDTRKNELNVLSRQRQQMELTLQTLKKQEDSYRSLGNKATEVLNNLQAKAQSLQQIMANAGVQKNVAQSINDYSELEKALEQARLKLEQYYDKVQNGRKPNLLTETGLKNRVAELEAAQAAWNRQAAAINYAESAVQKYTTKAQSASDSIKTMTSDLTKLEGKINTASTNLKVAEAAFQQIKTAAGTDATTAINNFFNTLQKAGFNIQGYGRTVDEAKRALKDFENAQRTAAVNGVQKVLTELQAQSGALQNNKNDVDKCTESWKQYINHTQEVDTLKSRIFYFFSLNNAIQLVRRTMREAFNTIKELDKAMTETAVVTDFSVGDMWAQLPEYTKRANELGVTTKAAYEAATLYYQQGLKTNEVMAMSNETLKMARIAGLDAAVATDRMTNAIRGFNMEINTTNAQRIDDVYSKLAAISASNVDEISTAMTKVASLAHNANMEFETTAAFLAQIIETTRESAETAGTALKTVVARFSEVKKLVSEGALSGSDEEGEVIDVNKVSSALRTAGIDLNKYFLGEVGLDDIFMELASKWKSLTQLQQRFIATQAAGSRQQSRFIALMSDYARTQELVGEAYNANGAAAKQFAKTQESLESKLARLKNAWNEFAMGILNSDLVKVGVDLLTNILNGINALTSGFGLLDKGVGGVINSVLKLATLLGSLQIGKGLIGGIVGGTQGMAGAMGLSAPGKNALTTLGIGAINPIKNIATGIGSKLSGIGFNAINANYAGSTALSGKLAAGVFGKPTGAGMATGAAQGIAGVASLLPAIAGITAAAGVAYVAIKKLYDASPAGQIKIAEKYADSLNEVANAAKISQREFESIQEEYNRLETNVQQATTAEERAEAIKSRTEYIQSLLEQNATYAQYIDQYEVKNGEIYLTLDSDKLAKACEKIAETALKVQSGADIANANVAFQQYQKAQLEVADLEEKLKSANFLRENYYGDSEEELAQWRKDQDIDMLEADLISAQSRMLAFQKEYESFANLGVAKHLTSVEKTSSGKELTDESRTFAASASKYSFNGDDIQKKITEETTRFFGLVSKETLGTLKGAQDAFIKQFKTSIIPEELKNDEEGLINAVAFDKAIESVLGPVSDNLANGFLELDKEYQNILLDLMNTGGQNLKFTTVASIKNNLPEKLGDLWDSLDEKLQDQLISASSNIKPNDTAIKILNKAFKFSDESVDILINYLKPIISSFDLTNKQTETISNLYTEFAKDNYKSLEPFNEFINNLIKSVTNTKDPELISSFFDTLETLDIDSASNIEVFFSALDSLGIDFHNVEGSAEKAADKLKELANVKDPFNAEDFSAKVGDLISTIWDIRERKSTQQGYRTFGEDEYQAIKEAIEATGSEINIKDIFKRTGIKNKEWNYVGGDLEELVQLLIQDLNKAIQQAEDYISEPEWLKEQSDFATNDVITVEDQNFTLEEALREIIANPDFIGKLQNTEQLQPIIAILEKMGYTWSESFTREGLIDIITKALTDYDQFLDNKGSQEEVDRAAQSVDYLTPINELHQRPEMDFDRYQSAVEGKFAVDEHAEDRYESILESIKGLSAAYKQLTLDEEEQEVTAKALAVNWSQQAAKLTELTEVLDKNDKILYESSKDSYEYSGAIHAVGEAMRAAYGEQVTDEFVQAHIQQIVMARESEEAYQELLDLLQQDFFSNAVAGAQGFEGELWRLQEAIWQCGATASQLDGMELNGVAILDDTPWMEVIKELWGNLEAFEAYLATCGWTLVLSEERDPVTGLPLHASLVRNQPTGYGGYQPYTGNNWGHGSSGGGSSPSESEPTKEEWRSDFDWLYNLMEDLAELQREQNKLQEEQNKILELGNNSDTGKDLYENLVKQMANLLTQKSYQQFAKDHRSQEMQEFMAANAGYSQYFRFNNQDQTLEINWDAINNIGDKETYEKVKDLVSQAEAIQKKMDESDDALRDIETQIRQLENIWREQYVDFEKRVLDALVKSYQRVIDNYSDLNDTVTKANDDILNALQEEINLERQIRDNTETEDQISDAEARLAFLRRDTTGGNQVEILGAQQQLDEMRQSYQDQLIDQSISRLQDDNAKAAEQRERQIELMQAQLDYAVENGELNGEVRELITNALGADGELLTNSDLVSLLQQEESWAAMSATNKELWEDELNNTFKEVSAYLLKEQGEIDGSFLQDVAAAINDNVWASANVVGDSLEVGLGSMGQSIGLGIGSMSQAMDHVTYTYDNAVNGLKDANNALREANAELAGLKAENDALKAAFEQWQNQPDTIYLPTDVPANAVNGYEYDYETGAFKKKPFQFATGGLNTQTGPAWLDGTPSKPEYILNPLQTEAFLKLADVLPSIFNGASASTNNVGGTMYLNFDINIDSISNDYDVDQLVERVKDDIYNAASYRNANVINFSK